MFKRILIANRGEIASRIIRSAHKLNIETVTLYSDIDKNALYVQESDFAYSIGGASTQSSYLNFNQWLSIAKNANVDAIHPGYGFLSENADFADTVTKAGITFIGPSANAIRWMGSKAKAKQILANKNIPLIPGYTPGVPNSDDNNDHNTDDNTQDPDFLLEQAQSIGFPILIKASMGGGGKGMRIVQDVHNFKEALASAKREAYISFGNDEVILEKYFANPRHVEVQVFGDHFGEYVYLFERDCSIQRRHQKIMEEAPAPWIDESLRQQMGQTALAVAKAIQYTNAGTVEFLLEPSKQFYFMEMNTRLQVEHPVTEMITGLDLVEWQIRIAAGEKLPLQQNQITHKGHSFEVRLYAEDPSEDFLPATGTIAWLKWPALPTRIDTGVKVLDKITVYYDPLLAKIIVWAQDRKSAILAMQQALNETHLLGVPTNLPFLRALFASKHLEDTPPTTAFLALHPKLLEQSKKEVSSQDLPNIVLQKAAQLYLNYWQNKSKNPWNENDFWRINRLTSPTVILSYHDKLITIHIDDVTQIYPTQTEISDSETPTTETFIYHITPETLYLFYEGKAYLFKNPKIFTGSIHEKTKGEFTSPMPGTITQLFVNIGDIVKQNQPLLILEAMKMEHTLKAPFLGRIKALPFNIGDKVESGFELCILEKLHDEYAA